MTKGYDVMNYMLEKSNFILVKNYNYLNRVSNLHRYKIYNEDKQDLKCIGIWKIK